MNRSAGVVISAFSHRNVRPTMRKKSRSYLHTGDTITMSERELVLRAIQCGSDIHKSACNDEIDPSHGGPPSAAD